jgi:hypothetical protein
MQPTVITRWYTSFKNFSVVGVPLYSKSAYKIVYGTTWQFIWEYSEVPDELHCSFSTEEEHVQITRCSWSRIN